MLYVTIFLLLLQALHYSFGCRHNAATYRNGEEWEERNAFVMRCTIYENGSWKTEVVACVLPNGQRININSQIQEHNDEWKCQMNERGMVTLVQGANPNAKCDGRTVGSRWQEKSFELECRPGGIRRLVSCVTEDYQRIPVNGTKEVNGFTLVCQQFANGTVVFHGTKSIKPYNNNNNDRQQQALSGGSSFARDLQSRSGSGYGGQTQPIPVRCVDENGFQRSTGDYWVENHRFNKTCRATGAVEVVNCISRDGHRIPLNGQLIRDATKYSCEMTTQGTIRFAAGPIED